MLEFFQALNWAALFQVILIDLLLGGDNAVMIALACRNLNPTQRIYGILWGTLGAILLRVLFITCALQLLEIPGLKLAGGILLFWMGAKLMVPERHTHSLVRGAFSVGAAIKTIILADMVMSLDNVMAIVGAAQDVASDQQLILVIFGLLVSVPIIIWSAALMLKLMDRYPGIVTAGAALLGWLAGGMMVTDVLIAQHVGESNMVKWGAEMAGGMLVILLGRWLINRKALSEAPVVRLCKVRSTQEKKDE